MKNLFKTDYAEKFLVFSKFLSFDWLNVFFDQSKILCFQNMTFYLARLLFGWFLINRFWFLKLLIDRIWFSINRKFPKFSNLGSTSLDWYSIDSRPIETEKFSVFKYLTNFFFHASMVFRIHVHCTIFIFCIHLAVLQSYLSLFSHITCIHFAKLGTQLDLKIDWLIFESIVHFSICYFLCVNCRKYFS